MSSGLRVEVARSGGFAGITVRSSVDTGDLPPAEAEKVEALVDEVDWSSLPRPGARPGAADRFQYHLSVSGREKQVDVMVGEQEVTPALRRLVDEVLARRSAPRQEGG
ncbi:MAG: hypothetical protein M3396_08570 [Actinomycetota bacterium]|nr:hypothetical protein [Actinomycetota bacterium]MDQ3575740.1 hypothetical protein [Actinomycetota bacterium]